LRCTVTFSSGNTMART